MSEQNEQNKLKSCPFCGGKVVREAWYDRTDDFTCEKCGVKVFWDEKFDEEADALWNKRAT